MVRVGPYEIGKTLGRGNYGLVKLAINRDTGEQVAIKIIKKTLFRSASSSPQYPPSPTSPHSSSGNTTCKKDQIDPVKREIAVMRALNHKNIVALRDVYYSPKRVFMIMELVKGGELFESIERNGRQSEAVARHYFQQLVHAIHYCHHRGVYHRDLKPENLLIDYNHGEIGGGWGDKASRGEGEKGMGCLKITDFGFSAMKDYGKHLLFTNCGSPHYCAPEVWNGSQQGYDGRKNDAWSCGIILYVQLTGKQPFYDEDEDVLLDKINNGIVDYPEYLSEDAKDLLMHLLELDPKKRFSLSKVKRHPWFRVGYDMEGDKLMTQQLQRKSQARQKFQRSV